MFKLNGAAALLAFAISLVPTDSSARENFREPGERFQMNKVEEPQKQPEIKVYEGNIHCADHKEKRQPEDHTKCRLELTSNDGKTYDLDANEELATAVCAKHDRHLQAKVTAYKEPSFLFWGGDLKVVDYQITGELSEDFCVGFREGEALRDYLEVRVKKRKFSI
jgi:hypothetical protein